MLLQRDYTSASGLGHIPVSPELLTNVLQRAGISVVAPLAASCLCLRRQIEQIWSSCTDAVFPQRIYIVGGVKEDDIALGSIVELRVPTFDWFELGSMLSPRSGSGAAVLQRRIYVVGGISEDDAAVYARTSIYDIVANSWSEGPDMHQARAATAAAAADGCVYVIGGDDNDFRALASCERLDVAGDAWERLPDLNHARAGAGAVGLNGIIYAFGGTGRSEGDALTMLRSLERLPVRGPGLPSRWEELPAMKSARACPAAVAAAGGLLAIGGCPTAGVVLSTVEHYTPSSRCWSDFAALGVARFGAAAVCLQGSIYVFGGTTPDDQTTSVVESLIAGENSWTFETKLNMPRSGHCAVMCRL